MTNRQARTVTAVLVHGGFLGAWIWADTVKLLEARGVRSVTVDLPSSQDSSGRLPGLHDDAEAVRDALDGCADAVLCGHSYAGAVISEAAAGPHRPCVTWYSSPPPSRTPETAWQAWPRRPPRTTQPKRRKNQTARKSICARTAAWSCAPKAPALRCSTTARPAAPTPRSHCSGHRPRPQARSQPPRPPGATFRPPTSGAPKTGCPANSSAPAYWEHASHVLTLPAGHCPQWSRPDLVADLLWSIISSARPDAPC